MINLYYASRKNRIGSSLFKNLLFKKKIPYRYKAYGFKYNLKYEILYATYGKINSYLIKKNKILKKLNKKEDIAVIVVIKDRFDYKLYNSLKSIRNQDYDQSIIKVIVVDYDSRKELIKKIKRCCKKYNAEYFRVNNTAIWCKSHALNIAIKRAKTKYILSTDPDKIFKNNYIKEAIKELKINPYQVILSKRFDIKKKDISANTNIIKEYEKLKQKSKEGNLDPGTNLTLTYFYHKIRGYDENYKLWGGEDFDLIQRFQLLGIKIKDITNKTSNLHQWHPMHKGAQNKNYEKQKIKNWRYLSKNFKILRNKNNWGKLYNQSKTFIY